MRRSLDFGTLTGSLSTLKSSRSNGNSTLDGTATSPSPNGSRYGTIAGIPSSEIGSASNDRFQRPKSALSNGAGRAGRRAFALGSLFNVGQQDESQDQTKDKHETPDHPHPVADVPSSTLNASSHAPRTPDTPDEREHAFMRAVQAAKARDQAWEITVQPAPSEGLFLEYGSSRRNKLESQPRPDMPSKKGTSSSNTKFGGLSGRARRFLGRERVPTASATALSTTTEEDGRVNADPIEDLSMAPTSPPMTPAAATTPLRASKAGLEQTPPASPAKRPLESSQDDISFSPDAATFSGDRVLDSHSPSTSTPAFNMEKLSPDAQAHPDQLLVLYVTTGSSSLTLYRKIGQLTKLDDELRKHFRAHMPIAPRPSILSLSLVTATNARDTRGHTRRKSVLASLTRTFTSPTITRKGTPSILSSASQATIAEEDTAHLDGLLSQQALPAYSKTPSADDEQQRISPIVDTPRISILQSQLSNLSDYLTSLSCVAVIRASKQWTAFFRPGREDHESSRLESPPPSQSTISKGKRLKRMKSDTALETKSPMSSSPPSLPRNGANMDSHGKRTEVTPTRKEVRIDDSGIGVDSLGHYSARNGGDLGRGHPTESSTNSSSATSNSASASMKLKRDGSTDTDTSVSAMSLFIEHADANGKEIVGDPEVLEYMQRLRQDSEARHTSASDPFKSTSNKLKQEAKSSKSTITEYVPSSPVSPMSPSGENVDTTPPATLSDSLVMDAPIPVVTSPSDEPILAALEESMIDATPFVEDPNQLPPLSGATAVASEEDPTEAAQPAQAQELLTPSFLSPASAATDDSEAQSHISSLNGKKKSVSSLRRSRKSSTANTSVSHRTRSHKPSIRIEDFEILRVLGKGCAGKVLLARVKDATTMSKASGNNSLYAVKAIHKHHVLAHRELAHTLTEQNILRKMATETPNPFVVKMRWSFQDNDNLFLVLDFHPGGDLATQLSRWGRLGKDRTRFYAAEIIEGLESLHNSGVIYRDLKPENILLAADGHIVLTDFGLSKQFNRPSMGSDERGHQNGVLLPLWSSKEKGKSGIRQMSSTIARIAEITTTFCGTAEYLAPEVLLGHAYSYPVDMWSLGTMIYEMLSGVTPFYNEDHGIMYRRVLHEQLEFGASDYLDSDTRALLRGLLQKEPEFRMTTSRVKRSKYFEAIDWSFVNNKRYIPPFIPHLSTDDPADTQNFEECFLTMDLGFVDEKDTEEIEIKAKTSGKEPDKAFDKDGRDVFADYSFDGAWADPESEAEQPESDDDVSEEEDPNAPGETAVKEENKASSTVEEATDRLENGHIAQSPREQSATQDISTPPSSPGKRGEEAKYAMISTLPVPAQNEPSPVSQNGHITQPIQRLPEPGELPVVGEGQEEENIHDARLSGEASLLSSTNPGFRSSVEMPRMASPAELSGDDGLRVSEEHGDWDVVEDVGSHEVADNGTKGPRKRLLAGTNLFAKGVVDKYKIQLKPSTRMPTPTRSYTARGPLTRLASGSVQPTRSNKTSNQLSPSPSIGGMSDSPSSIESSEQVDRQEKRPSKGPTRRLISPKLLRASSDWMSNSLPSSPTPRFYMRRNKKSTAPEGITPPTQDVQVSSATPPIQGVQVPSSNHTEVVPPTASSVDSSATIPVEKAESFGLQPLTRHATRERYLPVNHAHSTEGATPSSDKGGR